MSYELVDASVDVRPMHVVLRCVTSGQMPDSGVVTFTTTFTDPEGHQTTLGHRYVDARVGGVFRSAHGEAPITHVDLSPITRDDTTTLLYPVDDIEGQRAGESRAQLDVDGRDAGSMYGTY